MSLASGEVRDGPERTIEKPSSRAATAFVPRLGKRMANNMNSIEGVRLSSTGRIVCANSLDCNQLVLLGALLRGIALQEGELNLVATDQLDDVVVSDNTPQPAASSSFDSTNEDGLKLLRMLHRGQMLRRDTRASLDGDEELVNGAGASVQAPKYGGTKRVAFTPRIGKR